MRGFVVFERTRPSQEGRRAFGNPEEMRAFARDVLGPFHTTSAALL
jgi:hypothetical protein